jgi:hypothetical protein
MLVGITFTALSTAATIFAEVIAVSAPTFPVTTEPEKAALPAN